MHILYIIFYFNFLLHCVLYSSCCFVAFFPLLLSFFYFNFHCFPVSTLCFVCFHSFYCLFAFCFYFSFFVSLVLINYSHIRIILLFFCLFFSYFLCVCFLGCCYCFLSAVVFAMSWVLFSFFHFQFFCYFFPFLPFFSGCTLLAVGSCIVSYRLCWRVGPGRPGWEHRVQDVGPPENFWVQGILTGMHVPRGIHIKIKTQPNTTSSNLQC